MTQSKSDLEKYIDKFYDPKITALDFMKVFFAQLVLEGISEYPRDLVENLYHAKQNPKFANLFRDIPFGSNGVHYYCDSIECAIYDMKCANLLFTISPKNDIIRIVIDLETAREFIKSIDEKESELIKELVHERFDS